MIKMNNAAERFFNRLQQQIEKSELENDMKWSSQKSILFSSLY